MGLVVLACTMAPASRSRRTIAEEEAAGLPMFDEYPMVESRPSTSTVSNVRHN